MTHKLTISPRQATLVAASLLAAVALLAFAGPGAANSDGGHPGFDDDAAAGQIASFDGETGMLVIDLAEGGSIAGLVTRKTWIESDEACESERRALHGWCRKRLHGFGHDGDDNGRHHGWRHHSRGDTDDLVPGATVEDALLVLKDGRAFFWKIELDD